MTVSMPPIVPSPPKNRVPEPPVPGVPEKFPACPLPVSVTLAAPTPSYKARFEADITPLDKPLKVVGVQVLLIELAAATPSQGLETWLKFRMVESGPVYVRNMVATESVKVIGLLLTFICSGVTLPPTPVSCSVTLDRVPRLVSN